MAQALAVDSRPAVSPEAMTPERFFAELLPKVFWHTRDVPRTTEGVLQVCLADAQRPTTWTVDVGRGVLIPGLVGTPDAVLVTEREDFLSLLSGSLDVNAAAREGRLRFGGKQALLVELARLIRPNTVGY